MITKGQREWADHYTAALRRHGWEPEVEETEFDQISLSVHDDIGYRVFVIVGRGIGHGPNPRPRIAVYAGWAWSGTKRRPVRSAYWEIENLYHHKD